MVLPTSVSVPVTKKRLVTLNDSCKKRIRQRADALPLRPGQLQLAQFAAAKRGGGQVEVALQELEDCLPDCRVPDQELDARETADLISTFLRTQPELDRRLFVRRYFHLEALSSLGKRFGLTESQVKSRLYRTRQKLKLLLEHEGVAI